MQDVTCNSAHTDDHFRRHCVSPDTCFDDAGNKGEGEWYSPDQETGPNGEPLNIFWKCCSGSL